MPLPGRHPREDRRRSVSQYLGRQNGSFMGTGCSFIQNLKGGDKFKGGACVLRGPRVGGGIDQSRSSNSGVVAHRAKTGMWKRKKNDVLTPRST